MNNIKNTTKYIQAIAIMLISAAFVLVGPAIVSADEYTDESPTIYTGYDGYADESSTMDTGYGYTDESQTVYTGYNNDYSGDTYESNTVTTGEPSYVSGYSTYYPTSYYVPTSGWTVTSGSFTAGNNYQAPATLYVPPVSTVTTGSFNGGSNPYYYYTQPTPTYYTQPTTVPNQVLAYTDTNPNPGLDSVYLSDVPYTGLNDYLPIIGFISALLIWSSVLAYMFLKRKMEGEVVFAKANAKIADLKKVSDVSTSTLMEKIEADNSDISKVEEYARLNKVLLSSDALAKIVRLSRLGRINASDYIRSVSTGEWVAIGENQIA